MQYHSTIFGQLLKVLSRERFERIARQHRTGRQKRALSQWGHFVAMVFSQATGLNGLRDLERVVERQQGVFEHLGITRVKRTTLADANATRPAALFEAVAQDLSGKFAGLGKGRDIIRLIDATRIFAGKRTEEWTASCGVKLHMMYGLENERPICFAVTPENVNDITMAQAMPIEEGVTYVFDKGFYHFAFWAKIDAAGSRFVTRLKKNSPAHLICERPVAEGSDILRDATVKLNERLQTTKPNPMLKPLRLIDVKILGGREITLISNDLESSAEDLAQLYKQRWQIELFFKWIKQNLKLSHFMGTSRNAITIQIMAALIVFMLLRISSLRANASLGLQAIARLGRSLLLARRPITDIFKPPPKPVPGPNPQLTLWTFYA